MRKYMLVCLLGSLFFFPITLGAVQLVGLEINETIIPGEKAIPLTVTGFLSNGQKQQIRSGLTWQSSDERIAQVSPAGAVYFSGAGGEVTISVFKGEASGRQTITVHPWPQSLLLENRLNYSEKPYRLLVKGRFSDGIWRYYGPEEKVQWSSSNPWVAWVNDTGVVTFTGEEGYVEIKAVWGPYADFVNTTVRNDEALTVWREGIKLKETEITYSPKVQQLTLLVFYHDGSEEEIEPWGATWSSSNPEVMVVDTDGRVSFTGKPGVATLEVSYGGFRTETIVKVERFLEEIKLRPSLNYMPLWAGVPLPLTVTALYNDGTELEQNTNLTWTIDNQAVASLSETGVLTFTGEPGTAKITVTGLGAADREVVDELVVNVPDMEKAQPRKLYIEHNLLGAQGACQPRVFCLKENGEKREVTEQVEWVSTTPETASVYQGTIYLAPNAGQFNLRASYQGLDDTLSGYNPGQFPGIGRVHQLKIKQHYVPFSFVPVQLQAFVSTGGGEVREVSTEVSWFSSQPSVASINAQGELSFSGRIGQTTLVAQGFGFRDSLVVEVLPADLQASVVALVLEGDLSQGVNHLKARAYFNDGTDQEVTSEAVWNTSDKNKAIVTEQGCVMFLGQFAPVTIEAYYGGKSSKIVRS